jgi:phosphatidylserine/phosphatidylglycerophosphate/cardiolipin synthase-like enzyme
VATDDPRIATGLPAVPVAGSNASASTLWAQQHATYPPRPGNEVEILIDGQAAYGEIAAAFDQAKKFIYSTTA